MKKTLAVLFIFTLMFFLCSCEKSIYKDDIWNSSNEIRIFIHTNEVDFEQDHDNFVYVSQKIPDIIQNKFSSLQNGICEFFLNSYGIDVSGKMAKQEIRLFKQLDYSNGFTGGYVTGRNSNEVNINILATTDLQYLYLLESIFIHETMHYLGFVSSNYNFLDEGMADTMAQKCADYLGIKFEATPNYDLFRYAANQMLIVNEKEIINSYINTPDFSLTDHVNTVLSDISYPFIETDNPGQLLSGTISVIGDDLDDNNFYAATLAQEILMGYCKSFNPNKDQINEIRNNYLILKFELIEIYPYQNGYCVKLKN